MAVGAIAVVASASGCDAHGFVGSNVSAAAGASGGVMPIDPIETTGLGFGTTGVGGDHSGADVTGASGSPEVPGSAGDDLSFDVGPTDAPAVCSAPEPRSCDAKGKTIGEVLGLGCDPKGGAEFEFSGHPDALAVHKGALGTRDVFAPREGERMLMLSTGRAADLARTHDELACEPASECPSTALDADVFLDRLPLPIDVKRVSPNETCDQQPVLVGSGDCSNTLEEEWKDGAFAQDYAEIRIKAKVPEGADAFAYQFALFSAEYPLWVDEGTPWNDMYVAWLESESWTGNISFDEHGNPISIGSIFLDYLDATSSRCDDPVACVAPELDGFAMDGHAATRWLETVAPVRAGEEIEVVFAVFDQSDAEFDTVVVLDNVHWTCSELPPITQPQG